MVLNNITHILDRFVIVNSLHEENQNRNSNMSGQNENQSSEKNSEEKKAASSFVDSGIHDCSKTSSQEELTQILEKVPNYESFNIHLTDDEDEEKKAVVSSSSVKESVKEIEMQMKLDYMAQVNKMQSEECLRAKEVVEVLLETNICLEKELKELIVSHEEECRILRNEIIALKKREAEMNKELELLRNTVKIIEKELNTFSKADDKEVVKRKINEVNETNDNESTKKTRLNESPVVKSSTETQTLEKAKCAKSSDIEIVDHRLETKSIVLSNHSSEPFDLGKYELVSYLNGNEAIRYKFHKAVEIGPKKQLILWSRLSIEKKHFPPNDFTIGNLYRDDMREIFIWDWLNKDDVITDALYDPDGNEITRTNFNIIMDSKETVNINCTI